MKKKSKQVTRNGGRLSISLDEEAWAIVKKIKGRRKSKQISKWIVEVHQLSRS